VNFQKIKRILVTLQITTLVMVFPAASIARAAEVTNLQFVINSYGGGALFISVPASETFTSMVTPEVLTNAVLLLETITVTDTRRGDGIAWTTFASASNLLSSTDTLTASTFSYASGIHQISGGTAIVTSQTRTSMNDSLMVENAASIVGNHVVTWRPTLTVPVPALKTPGTYVGTIIHSVS
jgi:hypothetical protein